jgi:hemerythrin-like domain-containing protein
MNDLWAALEAEHDAIWRLLDRLTDGPADPPEPQQQRRVARQLVAYQSAHELAEEMVLWPVVEQRCTDGAALVAAALQQEHQLKLALHELDHLSATSEEFTDCVHTVAALERTHLSYEQNQIWPRVHDDLPPEEIAELLRHWHAVRPRAATRPHPHLATRPAVVRAAVPVLAAADRARDALRRRSPL